MIKTKDIVHGIIYFIAILLTGLGINAILRSTLGAGAWDTVTNNLSVLAHITLGMASAIVNILILGFLIIYWKQIKFLFVLVPIFGIALAIDFWDIIIFDQYYPNGLFLQSIFFFGGTLILTFGLAFMINTQYPAMVFDELTLALMKLLKIKSFFKTRILIELFAIFLATLFGFLAGIRFGAVSYGSLVLAIIIGPIIAFQIKITKRFF